jgi:hypothetical protein
MKYGDNYNYAFRCRHCQMGEDDHTDGGKCLYASAHFEFWICDTAHCPERKKAFRMSTTILKTADGKYFHGMCIPSSYKSVYEYEYASKF